MWICTISVMPEMFDALHYGVIGRAIANDNISIQSLNLRDFALGTHKQIDDTPYGGGPGMVMMAEPLYQAIEHAKSLAPSSPKVVYLSPTGIQWSQSMARSWAKESQQSLIFIAGRYEGIDQRVIDQYVDIEVSVGDYVLSGGELAAMTLIDSVCRLLPGVLGNQDSASQDSFSEDNLLDHPHYTKPALWQNTSVPEILLSGNHKKIADWRRQAQLNMTARKQCASKTNHHKLRTGENQ